LQVDLQSACHRSPEMDFITSLCYYSSCVDTPMCFYTSEAPDSLQACYWYWTVTLYGIWLFKWFFMYQCSRSIARHLLRQVFRNFWFWLKWHQS